MVLYNLGLRNKNLRANLKQRVYEILLLFSGSPLNFKFSDFDITEILPLPYQNTIEYLKYLFQDHEYSLRIHKRTIQRNSCVQ